MTHRLPEFGFTCAVVRISDFHGIFLVRLNDDIAILQGEFNQFGKIIILSFRQGIDSLDVGIDDELLFGSCRCDVESLDFRFPGKRFA